VALAMPGAAHTHLVWGDAVLCTIATACRGAIREVDHLARLGGDEFALIAPGASSRSTRARDRAHGGH
jgi:GGDEF domain-containing protein